MQQCINTFGGYECACYDGYAINDTIQCIGKYNDQCSYFFGVAMSSNSNFSADINECEEYNDCHHICANTEGSYYCSCETGFSLAADNRTCTGYFHGLLYTCILHTKQTLEFNIFILCTESL